MSGVQPLLHVSLNLVSTAHRLAEETSSYLSTVKQRHQKKTSIQFPPVSLCRLREAHQLANSLALNKACAIAQYF